MQSTTSHEDLQEMFLSWLVIDKGVSKSTLNHTRLNIQKVLSFNPEYNPDTFRSYLAKIQPDVKPGTLCSYILSSRLYCDFLIHKGLLTSNWAKGIRLPKCEKVLPTILTVPEIKQILNCDLPNSYRNFRDPQEARLVYDTVLWLLATTGARIGEVLKIRIEDINLDDNYWSASKTKTKKSRLIPFPSFLSKNIVSLSSGKSPKDFLFSNPRSGKPLNLMTVSLNLKRRLKKVGITKHVSPHSFRHSFICELFRANVSPLKIANICGHDRLQTTMDYARLIFEDLREAMFKHPLISTRRNSQEVLKDLKAKIDAFQLMADDRFLVELKETNSELTLRIRTI